MYRNLFGLNKVIHYVFMIIIVIAVVKATTFFFENNSQNNTTNQILERNINSALMQCYALEGAYPSDIYHLKEYGIMFQDEDFYYYYEYINGGIMPMVSVTAKPN